MSGVCRCGKVIMDTDLKIMLKGVQFCTECAFKELEKESEK